MLKLLITAVTLFGFAGSAFAQAPVPTEKKDDKPVVTQPAPGPKAEKKVVKKVEKKVKKPPKKIKKGKTEVKPEPAPVPVPAPK